MKSGGEAAVGSQARPHGKCPRRGAWPAWWGRSQPSGEGSSRREGVAGSGGLGLLSLKSARTPSGGQASGVTSRGPCSQ